VSYGPVRKGQPNSGLRIVVLDVCSPSPPRLAALRSDRRRYDRAGAGWGNASTGLLWPDPRRRMIDARGSAACAAWAGALGFACAIAGDDQVGRAAPTRLNGAEAVLGLSAPSSGVSDTRFVGADITSPDAGTCTAARPTGGC
jgi:hypothetical protein